ncbi:hypothetical protein [Tychonema sp. LEGE 06208]|uniref:hypothetical protein n=1 Tax=Tychonema sp. LEGE 06208 TaxID=1828663 RepID=UPI001880E0DE|nr:hypothetical protein [Tychonema sp. LEGE 06208]MBE9162583.1 hypothetical protein [Tychonema sp. LEGE 06208]
MKCDRDRFQFIAGAHLIKYGLLTTSSNPQSGKSGRELIPRRFAVFRVNFRVKLTGFGRGGQSLGGRSTLGQQQFFTLGIKMAIDY